MANKYISSLDERTLECSKRIIRMVYALPKNDVNRCLGVQILRSGTSMGANYREANETTTKKDLRFKIGICRKEAKETLYWIDLIIEANTTFKDKIIPLRIEIDELLRIFASIINKMKD